MDERRYYDKCHFLLCVELLGALLRHANTPFAPIQYIMKITSIVVSTAVTLAATFALHAQSATQDAPTSKFAFEPMPVLSASAILRPEYCKGLFLSVRDQARLPPPT